MTDAPETVLDAPPDPVATRAEAAFAQIEAAQRSVALLRRMVPHREGGRAFSVVRTKLDEARMWLDEAMALANEPETADGDRP